MSETAARIAAAKPVTSTAQARRPADVPAGVPLEEPAFELLDAGEEEDEGVPYEALDDEDDVVFTASLKGSRAHRRLSDGRPTLLANPSPSQSGEQLTRPRRARDASGPSRSRWYDRD